MSNLLTTVEAAPILGVTAKTLEVWRSLGFAKRPQPPYLKIGRKVWYERAVVERWLACRVVCK